MNATRRQPGAAPAGAPARSRTATRATFAGAALLASFACTVPAAADPSGADPGAPAPVATPGPAPVPSPAPAPVAEAPAVDVPPVVATPATAQPALAPAQPAAPIAVAAPPLVTSAVAARGLPAKVSPDQVTVPTPPRHRTFGVSLDLGVPDGAALGIAVRPVVEWLRLGAAVTHNSMAPGVRVGVTVDPIAFPVAPTLTVEGGHYWQGRLPGVSNAPSIGYNYANFHLGLEVGSRSTFRFFLRGGASWVDASASDLQASTGSSSIGNPSFTGWLAPSGKLGFATFF